MNDHASLTTTTLRRGLALLDTLVLVGTVTILLAIVSVLAGAIGGGSSERQSAWNLTVLAQAHTAYAVDWEGRQFSLADDRLGQADGNPLLFQQLFGCHPDVVLGETAAGETWGWWLGSLSCTPNAPGTSANMLANKPFNFDFGQYLFGAYQLVNVRGFNEYVDGRFYSPTFYAPDSIDGKNAQRFFDDESEFAVDLANTNLPTYSQSSYILSPAAMFDPEVFAAPSAGGWRDPDNQFDTAYESPAEFQARHPALKTRMIEKDWLRGSPTRFHPGFTGPSIAYKRHWFFNHGVDASPLALFFDGSVDRINAGEATEQDEALRTRTGGDGLWSRDTPLGNFGYYGQWAADVEVSTSHTILTTDGILGRDLVWR